MARDLNPEGTRSNHEVTKTSPFVRFGNFRLERGAQRLLRDGEEVRLDPKTWDLLTCLVDRAGRVVDKETIFAEVWRDVVVSDAALSQTMMRLRAALGDDARRPRYVATVPRRGFRFIANVVEIEASEVPPQAADSTLRTFVGRAAELAQLTAALAAANNGERRFVMISGEAGIGKTALTEVFLANVRATWRVLRAQCIEQQGSAEPYMPLLDAVDRLANSAHGEGVVAVLRRNAPTWLAQMPWLIDEQEAARLRDALSDGTRPRMLREMAGAIDALAEERGLVLAIEDLHWSDLATLDLLAVVAQRSVAARLLVVGTFRLSHAIAFGHPLVGLVRGWGAKKQCTSIALEPLGLDDVGMFLARRFPGRPLPSKLAERLFARTEGNPLFLQTMVDHLVDEGTLLRDDGGWMLSEPSGPLDLTAIPDDVRQMIQLVLDRLQPADLSLLSAASVVGDTFSVASVAAALDADAGLLEEACEQLVRRWHLLARAEELTWPDGTRTARYEFRHTLYRHVLYDHFPPATRRRMHQAIGERLERAYQTDSRRVAAELAVHFDRSGDDARAVRYLLKAAHRARRRFADREAEALLVSALQRLERLPENEERSFQEVLARVELGQLRSLVERGARDEEEANSARAAQVAGTMSDLPILFPLFRGVWRIVHEVDGPARAAPLANRLLRLADANDSTELRVGAEYAAGLVDLMRGSLGSALAHFATAIERYESGNAPHGAALEAYGPTRWKELGVQILGFSGLALTMRGLPDQGRVHGRRGLDLCRTGRVHPITEAAFQFVAAVAECLLGELASAQSLNETAWALAAEHQLWKLSGMLNIQRGWIAMCRGEREVGMALMREQIDLLLQHRATSSYPLAGLYCIDGCRMMGDDGEGLGLLEVIRGECERRDIHWFDAELARLEAELLMLRGERNSTVASLLRGAVDRAEQQGAALLALRAAMTLRRVVPDDPSARRLLGDAHARLPEATQTPLWREAAALLRGPGGQKSQIC